MSYVNEYEKNRHCLEFLNKFSIHGKTRQILFLRVDFDNRKRLNIYVDFRFRGKNITRQHAKQREGLSLG